MTSFLKVRMAVVWRMAGGGQEWEQDISEETTWTRAVGRSPWRPVAGRRCGVTGPGLWDSRALWEVKS